MKPFFAVLACCFAVVGFLVGRASFPDPEPARTVQVATPHQPVTCVVYSGFLSCDWQGVRSTPPPPVTEYRDGPNGTERVTP